MKIKLLKVLAVLRVKLSQESTWRGIIGVATAMGVAVSPEVGEKIIATGLSIMGLINIIKKD